MSQNPARKRRVRSRVASFSRALGYQNWGASLEVPRGTSRLAPQFWYPSARLNEATRERTRRFRAGFCDITGQTNERSMLAALVPPGVICGNKVPTITFEGDEADISRLHLWLAMANSL